MDFDYQEWAALAKTDPEAFEERRRQYIGLFQDSAGKHRQRLLVLQFRINATRRLAQSSPKALPAISRLMIESLAELGDELSALELLVREQCLAVPPMSKEPLPCKVIPFSPRRGALPDVPESN